LRVHKLSKIEGFERSFNSVVKKLQMVVETQ